MTLTIGGAHPSPPPVATRNPIRSACPSAVPGSTRRVVVSCARTHRLFPPRRPRGRGYPLPSPFPRSSVTLPTSGGCGGARTRRTIRTRRHRRPYARLSPDVCADSCGIRRQRQGPVVAPGTVRSPRRRPTAPFRPIRQGAGRPRGHVLRSGIGMAPPSCPRLRTRLHRDFSPVLPDFASSCASFGQVRSDGT